MNRIDPTTSRLLQLVRPSLLGALTLIAAAGCLGGGGSGGAQNSEEAAMDDAEEDGTEGEGSNDPSGSNDDEPGASDGDEQDADEEDAEPGEDIGEDGSSSGSEGEDGEDSDTSGGSAGPAGDDGDTGDGDTGDGDTGDGDTGDGDTNGEDIDVDDSSELTPEEIEAQEDDSSSETEEDPEETPGEVGPSAGSIVVDTGLPEDTPLTELTEEDRLAMCEQVGSSLDESGIQEAQCEMVGAFSAVIAGGAEDEFQATCLAAKEECLADEAAEEQAVECNTEPVPDTCEATVGDLETCANQSFALFDQISCSSSQAEVLLILASGQGQQTSPECERMQNCDTSEEAEEDLSGGF